MNGEDHWLPAKNSLQFIELDDENPTIVVDLNFYVTHERI